VIQDVVVLLKQYRITDITIGEGTVTMNPKDIETPAHAFKILRYETLNKNTV